VYRSTEFCSSFRSGGICGSNTLRIIGHRSNTLAPLIFKRRAGSYLCTVDCAISSPHIGHILRFVIAIAEWPSSTFAKYFPIAHNFSIDMCFSVCK